MTVGALGSITGADVALASLRNTLVSWFNRRALGTFEAEDALDALVVQGERGVLVKIQALSPLQEFLEIVTVSPGQSQAVCPALSGWQQLLPGMLQNCSAPAIVPRNWPGRRGNSGGGPVHSGALLALGDLVVLDPGALVLRRRRERTSATSAFDATAPKALRQIM
jgi:hypothetical protein